MFRTPRSLFRTLAIAEAVSWTLLITGLVLRATTGWALGVSIGGGIHGFIFLSYAVTAVLVAKNQRWSVGPTVLAIVSAVIPYATIPTEIWLQRSGRLEGSWRLQAGADPRDGAWHDRFLRTLLRHPLVFGALLVVAVVVVFTVLLLVGPPGGK